MTKPKLTLQGGSAAQPFLDFPVADPHAEPVLDTPATRTARLMLERSNAWPEGQMALIGGRKSGKTRLLRDWAETHSAAFVSGQELSKADIDQISNLSVEALVVDDADFCENGRNLLAVYNLCRDRSARLLISGESDPSSWAREPLDLQSRLSATPVAKIETLDDKTFEMLLVSACKLKFMKLPEDTAKYLCFRLQHSYEVIEPMVTQLEIAANGKALTKVTARKAIEALNSL
jgi:chromosomal replication initiation ATPase DnaA